MPPAALPGAETTSRPRDRGKNLCNTGVHMLGKSVLLRFAAAGAIVLSTLATALPASAAAVKPDTGSACVNTAPFDPPTVCLTINGGGLYVENFDLTVGPGYFVGKFKVVGPTESWLGNLINVASGKEEILVINSYVPAGNYWGYFENEYAPGKYAQTAGAFVTVHS
jgi:hypothetical protein